MDYSNNDDAKSEGVCDVRRCRRPSELGYVIDDDRYGVCWRCWLRHCSDVDGFDLKAAGTLVLAATPILLIISQALLEALL